DRGGAVKGAAAVEAVEERGDPAVDAQPEAKVVGLEGLVRRGLPEPAGDGEVGAAGVDVREIGVIRREGARAPGADAAGGQGADAVDAGDVEVREGGVL